jgi:RHS repeat-associated protein
LGNSRVFFSDLDKDGMVEVRQGGSPNELLQQAHYYPFGMEIEGQWGYVQPQVGQVNAYLYNGKELNADFGLGWSDYGARWYDASIGRWNGVDALAEGG